MKKITFFLAALAFCLPQLLLAATLRVPADYPTLQDAVDAAAAGDTVMVSDGVYSGSGNCGVEISKPIILASNKGPDHTILDCPDSIFGIDLDLASDNHCPQLFPGHCSWPLSIGAQYYSDREYTLTGVPTQYLNMQMYPNPDDDLNAAAASGYISFGAYCDLVVYVAYDSRATALPGWMAGFSYTGDDLFTSLPSQDRMKIYSRKYTSGECVNLGGNKAPGFAGGDIDNYVLFFEEDGPCREVRIEGLRIQNTGVALRAWGQQFDGILWNFRPYSLHNCSLADNSASISAFISGGTVDGCSVTGSNTAMHFEYAWAEIRDSRVLNNTNGINVNNASVTLNRCAVSGNSGYGIYTYDSSHMDLYNSIVSFNGSDALMIQLYSIADIVNSTVIGNGAGLNVFYDASIDITNSIFRQNGGVEIQIPDDFNTLSVRNTNLEGGIAGITGGGPVDDLGGNIDADPKFIDPDGPDGIPGTDDDNLHLRADSICINAGTADLPGGEDFEFDIDHDPRIIGPAPDMGADEALQMLTFYRDRDRDGYGDPLVTVQAEARPRGYVANDGDCNDRRATVHPGALELCNRRDDDCDGLVDEECARNPKEPRAQRMLLPDPRR